MLNSKKILDQFADECIGCGLCVEVCPIVSDTELKSAMPEAIMEEILHLFRGRKIGALARQRIYSCLFCNTCLASCPQGLKPGLAFGTGKGLLQALGDQAPKGVVGIKILEMKNADENALCCGAYAITGMGKPGYQFRARRLQQAKDTKADLLSLYCPGCHMTLGPEAANMDLCVESILTLLGKSLGIDHALR